MIQIEITTQCNAKCIYCFKQAVTDENRCNMPFECFRNIVDFIPWKNNRWLLQGSGEPLLCPDLFEMSDYIYSKDPNSIIEIITNGSLVNEEVFYKLINHHINRITISADAIGIKYEKYRKGLSWNKIRELLEIIKNYKETNVNTIPIGFAMVLMKSNIDELISYINYMSDFFIDFISINALEDTFNNFQEEVLEGLSDLDIQQKFNDAKLLAETKNMKVYFPITGEKRIFGASERCSFSEKSMYISVDGKIDPCCMLSQHGFWGNIENANFSQIEKFNIQWEQGDYPNCCKQCISNGTAFIGK